METNKQVFKCKYKTARISPRKASLVANSVRGLEAKKAVEVLKFQNKKAAGIILETLNSAISNAKYKAQIGIEELEVSDVLIGPGMTIKKIRFESRSRVHPILKRTTNITVVLNTKSSKVNNPKKEAKVEQKS